eukprot:gene8333-17158_t
MHTDIDGLRDSQISLETRLKEDIASSSVILDSNMKAFVSIVLSPLEDGMNGLHEAIVKNEQQIESIVAANSTFTVTYNETAAAIRQSVDEIHKDIESLWKEQELNESHVREIADAMSLLSTTNNSGGGDESQTQSNNNTTVDSEYRLRDLSSVEAHLRSEMANSVLVLRDDLNAMHEDMEGLRAAMPAFESAVHDAIAMSISPIMTALTTTQEDVRHLGENLLALDEHVNHAVESHSTALNESIHHTQEDVDTLRDGFAQFESLIHELITHEITLINENLTLTKNEVDILQGDMKSLRTGRITFETSVQDMITKKIKVLANLCTETQSEVHNLQEGLLTFESSIHTLVAQSLLPVNKSISTLRTNMNLLLDNNTNIVVSSDVKDSSAEADNEDGVNDNNGGTGSSGNNGGGGISPISISRTNSDGDRDEEQLGPEFNGSSDSG